VNLKTAEFIISQGQRLESLIAALSQHQTQQYTMSKVNVVQTNSVTVITTEKVYLRATALFMQTIVLDLSSPSEGRIHIITGGGPGIDLGALGHMHNDAIGFLQEICRRNSWTMAESKSST
jgi:hypothetical protein